MLPRHQPTLATTRFRYIGCDIVNLAPKTSCPIWLHLIQYCRKYLPLGFVPELDRCLYLVVAINIRVKPYFKWTGYSRIFALRHQSISWRDTFQCKKETARPMVQHFRCSPGRRGEVGGGGGGEGSL